MQTRPLLPRDVLTLPSPPSVDRILAGFWDSGSGRPRLPGLLRPLPASARPAQKETT